MNAESRTEKEHWIPWGKQHRNFWDSSSQPCLQIAITWGALKKYSCLGPFPHFSFSPQRLWFNLGCDLDIRIFINSPCECNFQGGLGTTALWEGKILHFKSAFWRLRLGPQFTARANDLVLKNGSPMWHWRCDHIPPLEGEVSSFSTFNNVLLPQVKNSIRFLPLKKKAEWLHFNEGTLKPDFQECQFLPIYEMRVWEDITKRVLFTCHMSSS